MYTLDEPVREAPAVTTAQVLHFVYLGWYPTSGDCLHVCRIDTRRAYSPAAY